MNHLQLITQLRNTYFVLRHGKSIANQEGIILSNPQEGVLRYGLVEEGKEQVRRSVTEAKLQHTLDNATVIIASDFKRAKETAEIAKDMLGSGKIIFSAKLRERSFGLLEKQHKSNYQKVWNDDESDAYHKRNNVESTQEVLERITVLVKELEETYKDTTILLVSHGDTLQILQTAFEQKNSGEHRQLSPLQTGEIRKFRFFSQRLV